MIICDCILAATSKDIVTSDCAQCALGAAKNLPQAGGRAQPDTEPIKIRVPFLSVRQQVFGAVGVKPGHKIHVSVGEDDHATPLVVGEF